MRPAWFPDGQAIAVAGWDSSGGAAIAQIMRVNVETGADEVWWSGSLSNLAGFALTPDGASFLIAARPGPNDALQILRGRPPAKDLTRVTNDLNEYVSASLSGDSLVTLRRDVRTTLMVWEGGRTFRPLGHELSTSVSGLVWASDDRVMFRAALAGGTGLWSLDLSGGPPRLNARCRPISWAIQGTK